MDLLLDTHAFIWFVSGEDDIPLATRQLIQQTSGKVFVSVASLWEMAIKSSLGNLAMGRVFAQVLDDLTAAEMELLPITFRHTLALSTLPFPSKAHRDPFDRMLIAQAKTDKLTLISKDRHFADYEVALRW